MDSEKQQTWSLPSSGLRSCTRTDQTTHSSQEAWAKSPWPKGESTGSAVWIPRFRSSLQTHPGQLPTLPYSRVGSEFTSSKTQKKDKGGSGWDQDQDAVSFDRTLTLSSSQREAHRAGAGLRVKTCHGGHCRPPPAGGRLVAAAGEPHRGRKDPSCPELTPLPSPSWPHPPGMQSKAGWLPG